MEIIRPVRFGAQSLPDRESRLVCRSILLDMLGESTITAANGSLDGVTGLFWTNVCLSLATFYFPDGALQLAASGVNNADVVIMRAIDGPLMVRQRKGQIVLQPRDVVFVPADAPLTITLPQGGRLDCAHLPGHAIAGMRENIDRLAMQRIDADCLPLGLLANYAGYLLRQDNQHERDAAMMVQHFYHLLPVLAQHFHQPASQAPVLRRAGSIKAVIDDNLANSAFSINDVADHEGISPRAVQKFFQRDGTTFSRYVLEKRLAMAKSMILADEPSSSISRIAYEVGFNDLSYFNRTFRARYGVRPSDLRRIAVDTVV